MPGIIGLIIITLVSVFCVFMLNAVISSRIIRSIIRSIFIMLFSAFCGMMLGSTINAEEMLAIIFTMIAGFACTIHAIATKNKE